MPDSYMPFNIPLHQLDTPVVKKATGADGVLWSTAAALRDGSRESEPEPPQGILFQDDFNSQSDWDSGLAENDLGGIPNGLPDTVQSVERGHTLPAGWDYVYQVPTVAESLGDTGKREVINIKASDAGKAKDGAGKCFVQQRVASGGDGNWKSDDQLFKILEAAYQSLYVEFEIAFDPGWTFLDNGDMSKIFRAFSWNGQQPLESAFPDGNQGPLFVWDWQHNAYGVRSKMALRGGPWGDNYYLTGAQEGTVPSSGSINYSDMIQGMGPGGANPQLVDKLNGGFLPSSGLVEHPQVFGNTGQYTKVGFFLQMNSAAGVADGVIKHWIDGQRVGNYTGIMWVPSLTQGLTEIPGWNVVSIGGNDWFKAYPEEDQVQEWYAIDNIVIRSDLPEGLE